MPIPSAFDRKVAQLDDLAASVLISVRVLRHTPGADPRQLRERLQAFCDAVLSAADEIIATR
jgi:hypothetical protein